MTALSVVIPCHDRARLLGGCLDSLSATPTAEVIVVDAASPGTDVQAVAEHYGAHYVRQEARGASAARNAGARQASCPHLAFLDDDCRVLPDWAEFVVAALQELDAVCGRVEAHGPGHLSVLTDPSASDYGLSTPVAALGHGANLAVRAEAFAAVGGWDETLGPGTAVPGGEDKELLVRLLCKGFRVGYRPEPAVEHVQWRNRRQVLRAELGYARGSGALAARGLAVGGARDELRTAVRDLRHGYQLGAVAGLLRAVGIVWGRRT
ncbi:MAG: glycosyltransferase [Streptomyces sp.]|uniref:glycosyltransferase family 2 protein n=1 Tax=Streptomyces sp. TaxID=1931 RepID=UPI0025DC5F7B|nr:glycosyltransferase [Streptomyces sp.]MBW8792216.1 glycosyltransferase [Streptomyces sp.]